MTTTDADRDKRLAAINEAILSAGGLIAFCREMGLTHQAVNAWRRRGYVPPGRAVDVEHKFGVPRIRMVHPDVARMLTAPSQDALSVI